MRKGKKRERGITQIVLVEKKKKIHLWIIYPSADVIAQVIYARWINAQPTAQVNIVIDIQLKEKKKQQQQPSVWKPENQQKIN